MKNIPLKLLARQSLTVMLEQSLYEISMKECNGIMAATIVRDDVTLVENRRVCAGMTIIPEGYLEEGNFVILTVNGQIPYYTNFESTDELVYLSMEEVEAIRSTNYEGPEENSIPSGPLVDFDYKLNALSYGLLLSRATVGTYLKGNVLRTAAINVARFEDNGLLVEGASTNITYPSENWPSSAAALNWVNSVPDTQGYTTLTGGSDPTKSEGSYRNFISSGLILSRTATFSMDVKKTLGYSFRVRAYVGGNGSDGFGNTDGSFVEGQPLPTGSMWDIQDNGTWLRISLTRKFGDGTSIFRIYPFGNSIGASGSLTYRRVQVELNSIATSYIKTTTANATRDRDILSLSQSGAKKIYREYVPLGSQSLIKELVDFKGIYSPPGNLQVLRVWNRDLTSAEIKELGLS